MPASTTPGMNVYEEKEDHQHYFTTLVPYLFEKEEDHQHSVLDDRYGTDKLECTIYDALLNVATAKAAL